MKKALNLVPLIVALCLLPACRTLQPGADPVVVSAEQSIAVAYGTLDLITKLDNADRNLWKTKFPEAHKFAESLRVKVGNPPTARGLVWIQAAVDAKRAYQGKPTAENKQKLLLELATVATLNTEAQRTIDQTQPE